MYNDWFSIGPLTVHGYGACIAIGVLLALWMSTFRAKKRGLSADLCYELVFVGVIFGFIGAKILYLIVEWRAFLDNPWSVLSSSGFVVFGGLTCGLFAIWVDCRIRKQDFLTYMEHNIPSVALGQAFGRIGCFFAGCCYGRESTCPVAVTFHHSDFAPNDVPLLPTQLFSSAGNFLNTLLLLFIASRVKKKGIVLGCYFIFYSTGRFIIEFFRNDYRGSVGPLSTSQFYGIFAFLFGAGLLIWGIKHEEKPAEIAAETVEDKSEDQ
ncbi:MAG: prolipoprotein diacylglyceryl transferase [Lachnospiraceae bacterium]|nr:prolipoprotein diacylglyceryl transferase [Lachnospiraceae bacterium]